MAFLRTDSGITNMRLFYEADFIMFTEGGATSFSLPELIEGDCNATSIDVKFWDGIFKNYKLGKRIKFKPIGSKSTAREICEKIIGGEVQNVIVGLDRDMDEFDGELFDSPFILYTKGYSWENDVFSRDLTREQIGNMLLFPELPDEVTAIVDSAYDDFKRIGKHLVRLELIFRGQGIKFITEFHGERFFNGRVSPFIDKNEVFSILNEKRVLLSRPTNSLPKVQFCPFLNNYGKLIQALSITIITYIGRKYGELKSFPKDLILSAMLERYFRRSKDVADDYYASCVNELGASL